MRTYKCRLSGKKKPIRPHIKYKSIQADDASEAAEIYAEEEGYTGGKVIEVQGVGKFEIIEMTEYYARRL